jgi:hypothetical protein
MTSTHPKIPILWPGRLALYALEAGTEPNYMLEIAFIG